MTAHSLVYKLTLFTPKAEDPTESSVLTPRSGAAHGESFILTTKAGVGTKPYLDWPSGRSGAIDPLTKKLAIGMMNVRAFDPRVTAGGSNAERWVTAFLGDADGKHRLIGCKAQLAESRDGGVEFEPYFTGRIANLTLDEAQWISFAIRDTSDDLKRPIFTGLPHRDVWSAAQVATLQPLGRPFGWGNFLGSPKNSATVTRSSDRTQSQTVIERGTLTPPFTGGNRMYNLVAPMEMQGDHATPEAMQDLRALVTYNGRTGVFAVDQTLGTGSKGVTVKRYEVVADKSVFGDPVRGPLDHWTEIHLQTIPGHPHYMPFPPAAASVSYALFMDGPPTQRYPLFITDVHPVQLFADLLDGYYSRLSESGQPRPVAPRDDAAFDRMIADPSFGTVRFRIEQEYTLNEFVEKHILQPFDLSYRIDGEGRVVPIDARRSAYTQPAVLLTDDDLFTERTPGWTVARDGCVTAAIYKYSVDTQATVSQYLFRNSEYPSPSLVNTTTKALLIYNDLSTLSSLGDPKTITIEALGTRFHPGEIDATTGELKSETLALRLKGRVADMMAPYATGVTTLRHRFRRTDAAMSVFPGTWVSGTFSKIPDPATNERGGPRLLLCTARSEQGIGLDLDFLDAGATGVSVAPSGVAIAVAGDDASAIDVTFTRNAAGHDVRVEYALTATTTSTRPHELSELWTFADFATGASFRITSLPRGARVWVRVRSQVRGSALALPSVWVFPTPTYLDLTAITAPSSISRTNTFANRTDVAWTNGDSTMTVELYLVEGGTPSAWSMEDMVFQLGPGTTRKRITGLTASTAYTIGLRHRDPKGGFSAMTTHAFTSGSTAGTAPRPAGLDIIVRPSA